MVAPAGALTRLKVSIWPASLSVADAVTLSSDVFTMLNVVSGRLSTGAVFRSVRGSSSSTDSGRGRRLIETVFCLFADRIRDMQRARADWRGCVIESLSR